MEKYFQKYEEKEAGFVGRTSLQEFPTAPLGKRA